MCCVRFPISVSSRTGVESHVKTAPHRGRLRQVQHLLAIRAVLDGQSCAPGAWVLRVPEKDRRDLVAGVLWLGAPGHPTPHAHRPPTHTDPHATSRPGAGAGGGASQGRC